MLVHAHTVLAAASSSSSSGNFLVAPNLGVMIWTVLAFLVTMVVLRKLAFPRIAAALDRRQAAIEESIDSATQLRTEAEAILAEYRTRLEDARAQAEEIITRARRTGEDHERETLEQSRTRREEMLELTKREIADETRRAIEEIRKEVANLTILATEKVTRKTLDSKDQRRLVEEALSELDFSALQGSEN
jgi:F-type H+-transporting ATPase subunit b